MEIPLKTTSLDLDLLIVYAVIMFYVCKTTEFVSDLDDEQVWLGLHRGKSFKFQWLNEARKVEFINWASGEPNTGLSRVCVSWNYFDNSDWTDDPCDVKYKFLCEKTPIDCSFVPQGFVCKQECTGKCREEPGYVVCDDRTGNCFSGCADFYSGSKCDTLCQESYGRDCSSPCNPNCGGPLNACDPFVGNCTFGCDVGFQGVFCESPCTDGTYGLGCAEKCSPYCKGPNDKVCDKIDGDCPDGCQPGYTEKDCLSVCNGTYGQDCAFSCNPNCGGLLNTCDPVEGNCTFGCDDGFQGVFCESPCTDGTYGFGCAEQCSPNCNGPNKTVCDKIDGHCPDGCNPGYTGEQCLSEAPASSEDALNALQNLDSGYGIYFGILLVIIALGLSALLYVFRGRKNGDVDKKTEGSLSVESPANEKNPSGHTLQSESQGSVRTQMSDSSQSSPNAED